MAVGATLGLLWGQLFFNSGPLIDEREQPPGSGAALLLGDVGSREALSGVSLPFPRVEALLFDEAVSLWNSGGVVRGQSEAQFQLGLLRLAMGGAMTAMVDFFNQGTGHGDARRLKALAKAVFAELASQNPTKAFLASLELDDDALSRSMRKVVLENWAERDPTAALEFSRGASPDVGQDRALLGVALRGLAKRDPHAAVAAVESLGQDELYASVLGTWLSQDHEAGLAWVEGIEEPDLRERLFNDAVRTLTVHDPDVALKAALAVPHRSGERHPGQMMVEYWMSLPFADSLDRAMEALPSLPSELLDAGFLRGVGVHAALRDPAKAMRYAEQLPMEDLREPYWEGVISQIAYKDPVRASGLVEHLQDADHLGNAYESIMRSWMRVDEFGAAQWLAELASSRSKDQALKSFSDELMAIDPERAIQWASTIGEPEKRARQVERLVKEWGKADESAAAAWREDQGP